jgi:hypothetical protein
MKKTIKITEEIKCGELTCTDNTRGDSCSYLNSHPMRASRPCDNTRGDSCSYLNGDVDGYYCQCFFGTRLLSENETLQPLRCDKCKEAEERNEKHF